MNWIDIIHFWRQTLMNVNPLSCAKILTKRKCNVTKNWNSVSVNFQMNWIEMIHYQRGRVINSNSDVSYEKKHVLISFPWYFNVFLVGSVRYSLGIDLPNNSVSYENQGCVSVSVSPIIYFYRNTLWPKYISGKDIFWVREVFKDIVQAYRNAAQETAASLPVCQSASLPVCESASLPVWSANLHCQPCSLVHSSNPDASSCSQQTKQKWPPCHRMTLIWGGH